MTIKYDRLKRAIFDFLGIERGQGTHEIERFLSFHTASGLSRRSLQSEFIVYERQLWGRQDARVVGNSAPRADTDSRNALEYTKPVSYYSE